MNKGEANWSELALRKGQGRKAVWCDGEYVLPGSTAHWNRCLNLDCPQSLPNKAAARRGDPRNKRQQVRRNGQATAGVFLIRELWSRRPRLAL